MRTLSSMSLFSSSVSRTMSASLSIPDICIANARSASVRQPPLSLPLGPETSTARGRG